MTYLKGVNAEDLGPMNMSRLESTGQKGQDHNKANFDLSEIYSKGAVANTPKAEATGAGYRHEQKTVVQDTHLSIPPAPYDTVKKAGNDMQSLDKVMAQQPKQLASEGKGLYTDAPALKFPTQSDNHQLFANVRKLAV